MLCLILQPTQAAWRVVFFIAAGVYVVCGGIYVFLSSGERQKWDNPENDKVQVNGKEKCDIERNSFILQNSNNH
jgi:hypothetical protein